MFHLTPRTIWEAQLKGKSYRPEPFATEGFIHCTIGEDNVIAVGNRYYTSDHREMLCLVINKDLVAPEIRFDDATHIFPHVYGPLNLNAVVAVRSVERDGDGTFLALGDEIA